MRKLKVPAIALIFALNVSALHADDTEANLERLMDLSGISESIAAVSEMISSEMSGDRLAAEIGDAQVANVVSRSLQSSLTTPLFQRSIKQAMRDRLNNDELSSLLAWYDTPLGKRVAAANQSDQWAIEKRISAGERPELTAKRRALVEKLDQVAMGSDNAMELAIDSAAVVGHTMVTGMGTPFEFDEFRQMVATDMQRQKAELVEEYHATQAFIYVSLSNAEIEQMIGYMIQPEATVFYNAMWSGLRTAFHEGGAAMGHALVAELQGSF